MRRNSLFLLINVYVRLYAYVYIYILYTCMYEHAMCSGLKEGKAAEITPGYSLSVYSITEAPSLLHDHRA